LTAAGPRLLSGHRSGIAASVRVPPSKSLTNRALVLAALADGGTITSPLACEDTLVLGRALGAAGWPLEWGGAGIEMRPRDTAVERATVHLGNSGTGARLLMALLATVPGTWVVDGTERLRERPMGPLVHALRGLGVALRPAGGGRLPVEVRGCTPRGGRLRIWPGASSQFVSALLLAAPRMARGLELHLEGPVPSRPYLELTRRAMVAWGLEVRCSGDGRLWKVPPGLPRPVEFAVEGDWSAASFFAAAAAGVGGSVEIRPLDCSSGQGDRSILDVLTRAGARWETVPGGVRVVGGTLVPFRADLADSPDLFPALAVVAAAAPPGSELTGLAHLRHKESDRLGVMTGNLRRCGARLETTGDTFRVLGSLSPLERAVDVVAAGDHRIAMAMAVAALVAGPLRLDDAGCVAKSFPGFWDQWNLVTDG